MFGRPLQKKKMLLLVAGAVLCSLGLMIYDIWFADSTFELGECRSWTQIRQSDTLRVATSPQMTGIFQHRGHWLGHDYELTSSLSSQLGLHLEMQYCDDRQQAFDSLFAGRVDLVLMSQLCDSLDIPCWAKVGGSIDSVLWVSALQADTLSLQIDSVNQSNNYFHAVARSQSDRAYSRKLHSRRVENTGTLSPYDNIFRKYAAQIGWDWRMLATIANCESSFRTDLVSSRGAAGIMQMMPAASEHYGCPVEYMCVPDSSIKAGAALIQNLETILRNRITRAKSDTIRRYADADSALQAIVDHDLICFTLASYNAGPGHVFDAIALADTLGYDPAVWHNNVEHCLRLKHNPVYLDLPCIRLGHFNPAVTLRYVIHALETYEDFCDMVEE